jgi:hypothetical protein
MGISEVYKRAYYRCVSIELERKVIHIFYIQVIKMNIRLFKSLYLSDVNSWWKT